MPSDDPVATPEVGGRGLAYWLRSQELGLACGLATVALLAVGSVVLPATADGASKGIALDDVRPFFDRPSSTHAWFYGLVAVLAAYALNTALATWHSVTRRWRAGVRAPTAYAPMIMPSITECGSPSSTRRFMNAPGSPSSALQTIYFGLSFT